jgi:hypothetical protein
MFYLTNPIGLGKELIRFISQLSLALVVNGSCDKRLISPLPVANYSCNILLISPFTKANGSCDIKLISPVPRSMAVVIYSAY